MIEQVTAAVNRMQADGVIDRYAIGGAVAATFYLEPVATLHGPPRDKNVFSLNSASESGQITVDRLQGDDNVTWFRL